MTARLVMKAQAASRTRIELDVTLPEDPVVVGEAAAAAQALGVGTGWIAENRHDAFVSVAASVPFTTSMRVGTGIAVAFARSPLTVAYSAHDLQRLSGGRFVLGLGTQVRAHVVRRFSMPWTPPVERMREYISALRAIWQSWETGEPLDFNGESYSHNLMTPNFTPPPNPYGPPPVHLAAFGRRMTTLAGELAGGLLTHPFASPRFLFDITRPALAEGLDRSGRDLADVEITHAVLVATGRSMNERISAERAVRAKLAFYGSTPAYAAMMRHHGWEALHRRLHELSLRTAWDKMTECVDDEMLHTLAIVGAPSEIGPELIRRYGGLANRVRCVSPSDVGGALSEIVAGFRGET